MQSRSPNATQFQKDHLDLLVPAITKLINCLLFSRLVPSNSQFIPYSSDVIDKSNRFKTIIVVIRGERVKGARVSCIFTIFTMLNYTQVHSKENNINSSGSNVHGNYISLFY